MSSSVCAREVSFKSNNLDGWGSRGLGLVGEESVGEALDVGLENRNFKLPENGRAAERAARLLIHPVADAEAAEDVAATQHRWFDEHLRHGNRCIGLNWMALMAQSES